MTDASDIRGTFDVSPNHCLDGHIKEADSPEILEKSIQETFLDSQYRTVITTEEIKLYRIYGGSAKREGSYCTDQIPTDRMAIKTDLALNALWKNSRTEYCEVTIPKGTVLNVGKAAAQITESGYLLPGGMDQIVLPKEFSKNHAEAFGQSKELKFNTRFKEFEKKARSIESQAEESRKIKAGEIQIEEPQEKFLDSLEESKVYEEALNELSDQLTAFSESMSAYTEICWIPKEHEMDLAFAKADMLTSGLSTALVSICLVASSIKNKLRL